MRGTSPIFQRERVTVNFLLVTWLKASNGIFLFGKILSKVQMGYEEGQIKTKEEALKFVKKYLAQQSR